MEGKYVRIMLLCFSTMLCLTSIVYAQEKKGKAGKAEYYYSEVGFRGPSQPRGSILVTKAGIQATPAASAKSLSYDTPVMLVGNITQSIEEDLYIFKDTSGEIPVRIKYGDWKGLSVEASDVVVIAGYVKSRVYGQMEVDARVISKAKM